MSMCPNPIHCYGALLTAEDERFKNKNAETEFFDKAYDIPSSIVSVNNCEGSGWYVGYFPPMPWESCALPNLTKKEVEDEINKVLAPYLKAPLCEDDFDEFFDCDYN